MLYDHCEKQKRTWKKLYGPKCENNISAHFNIRARLEKFRCESNVPLHIRIVHTSNVREADEKQNFKTHRYYVKQRCPTIWPRGHIRPEPGPFVRKHHLQNSFGTIDITCLTAVPFWSTHFLYIRNESFVD